ncbi:MAG: DUF3793 family protein [Treponema sp.]|nr:DUF3793 family protein [Treponema sp.]
MERSGAETARHTGRETGVFRGKNMRLMNRRLLAHAYGLIPRLAGEILKLEALLRWAAGPVIAGIKPAALIRLPRQLVEDAWENGGRGLCESLGLSVLILREGAAGYLVLLYRWKLLARKLRAGPGARYLASLDYPAGPGLEGYLSFLKKRFAEPGFPHEVGIFLGYPLEDVISFSAGKPSPYACRGYWKVYHRPEKAERTFVYMDTARLDAIKELFSGSLPEDDRTAFVNKGDNRSPLSAIPRVLKRRRVTM